jgi:hypothetical protein
MYSKTNPGAGQLTRHSKRTLAIAGALVILALIGAGIWGAFAADPNSTSANGCVSVTLPSTMGGAPIHYCGASARSFCRSAFAGSDHISMLARPQCRLAGLNP